MFVGFKHQLRGRKVKQPVDCITVACVLAKSLSFLVQSQVSVEKMMRLLPPLLMFECTAHCILITHPFIPL